MGQFPVTNAEWRLFMAAGGYDNYCWWRPMPPTLACEARERPTGPKSQWRRSRGVLQKDFDKIRAWQRELHHVRSKRRTGSVSATSDACPRRLVPRGRRRTRAVNDLAFNHAAQPVVGVCWEPGWAYCAAVGAKQSGHVSADRAAVGKPQRAAAMAGTTVGATKLRLDAMQHFRNSCEARRPLCVSAGTRRRRGGLTGNVWEWASSPCTRLPLRQR